MACKYMIFLPVFIVFVIHRIVFSSYYQIGKNSTLILSQMSEKHGVVSSKPSSSVGMQLSNQAIAKEQQMSIKKEKQVYNRRKLPNSKISRLRVFAVNHELSKRFYRHYIFNLLKPNSSLNTSISTENARFAS